MECFEKWEVNCTFFLNNETFCDNSFVSHDECFESLCTPVSDEVQRMTKECLEIIFSGFAVVTRMLHDHLNGGIYSAITPEDDYEGLILFRKSKTEKWRDQLSEENLGKAMECARKSKQQQRHLYIKNKKEIFRKKSLCLQNSMEEKQCKEHCCQLKKRKL